MAEQKLTDNDIKEIVKLLKEKVKQADIAKQFGISQVLVSKIKTGQYRATVSGGPVKVTLKKEIKAQEKLERKLNPQPKIYSDETRRKLSEAAKRRFAGQPKSEEHKQKMKESAIKRSQRVDHPFKKLTAEQIKKRNEHIGRSNQKFTDEEALEIIRLHKEGYTIEQLAKEFTSYPTTIWRLITGETYKYLHRGE